MILYTDGYCLLKNPSDKGGGFTVFNDKNKLIHTEQILKKGFTNNEAELMGVSWAVKFSKKNWVIITDSQNTMSWIFAGYSSARPDLNSLIYTCKQQCEEKGIKLVWQPRKFNLAGIYNEDKGFDRFKL